ncbi:MAG: glycosyltransferase [Clostridia bacterium]|nr:glycosyltransferase [Clostridia bacterium]
MKKILFISGHLTNGGAQRVVSVVTSSLAEKGYDVSLLLFTRSKAEYPISPKVKIVSISENGEDYQKVSLFQRARFIRKYLKQFKPDVAVGFLEGGYALYISSIGMRFKKIASTRIDPEVIMRAKGFRAKINRAWFRSADYIVVQTESQRKRLPQKLAKKSVTIENPISDKALSIEKSTYSSCKKIVMAGRLAKQKNYPMVFRAISTVKQKYPDIHVDIFGLGDEQENLAKQISEMHLNENITLRGWSTDTIGEMVKYDAFILSSNYEGLPNSLMEAMAVGLPCISTDCTTGPSDLIKDGTNGFLVPVDDDKMLASRITELIEMDEDKRFKIGYSARKNLSDNYNSQVILKKWEDLILK